MSLGEHDLPAGNPEADTPEEAADWKRLDWRTALVGPVKALRAVVFPLVLALVGVTASTESGWGLAIAPVVIVVTGLAGVVPWLTTRYRFGTTRLEVHRGLVNKKVLTARLDRIRSVDLESNVLQRALGLAKVSIGTGVDETRIELDALSTEAAEDLRVALLARAAVAVESSPHRPAPSPASDGPDLTKRPSAAGAPSADGPGAATIPTELATFQASWARFAPLQLSRLAVIAGVLGALSQFADQVPFLDAEHARSAWHWLGSFPLALVLVVGAAIALVLWLIESVASYLIRWWNLHLVRDGETVRLTAGLFTTRSISVDESRVRGVERKQPLLLRSFGGAELAALSTGVENGSTNVLPATPQAVADSVGTALLGDAGPLDGEVLEHGPRARRRLHFMAQGNTLDLIVTLTVVGLLWRFVPWADWGAPQWLHDFPLEWWWIAIGAVVLAGYGALVAEARYQALGHRLTRDHLVAQAGFYIRRREVLQRDGIIGWRMTGSFFQRRQGLVNLVATTAAGSEKVTIKDVPRPLALGLIRSVTPSAVQGFESGVGAAR